MVDKRNQIVETWRVGIALLSLITIMHGNAVYCRFIQGGSVLTYSSMPRQLRMKMRKQPHNGYTSSFYLKCLGFLCSGQNPEKGQILLLVWTSDRQSTQLQGLFPWFLMTASSGYWKYVIGSRTLRAHHILKPMKSYFITGS